MSKQLQIRNSTAEFLIFQAEDKAQGVLRSYRVVQDQLYQSDFDKFTLPTLPFDGAED